MYFNDYLQRISTREAITGTPAHSYIDNDILKIELHAPGLTKKSVNVEICDNKLFIQGKSQKHLKNATVPDLQKEFILPDKSLATQKATAKYDAGILEIQIPLKIKTKTAVKVT